MSNIETSWGQEVVWAQGEKYIGKFLVFNKVQGSTGFRLYKESEKTLFVNEGLFNFISVDTSTGKRESRELTVGQTVHIGKFVPHSIVCLSKTGNIMEVGDNVNDMLLLGEGYGSK